MGKGWVAGLFVGSVYRTSLRALIIINNQTFNTYTYTNDQSFNTYTYNNSI